MSLAQLNSARELVRANSEQYPLLIRGILKVGDRPEPEIRSWSAGFVADFFGTEAVPDSAKDEIVQEVLPLLPQWIKDENSAVAKSGICVLCEIYPRVYKTTMLAGPSMKTVWDIVQVLKTMALARWTPESPQGLVIMCVKLAQVVVSTHQNVASNHAVLDNVMLTAEAAGLLERLISVFTVNPPVTFGVLSASLNASVALAISQPHLAQRIISAVLMFNVSKRTVATPSQLPLVLRYINKLFNLGLHPLQRSFPQIHVFLAGLTSYCTSQALKRPAADDVDEDNEDANTSSSSKRLKVDTQLPPGKQSYKALYTLSNDLAAVDARSLQLDLAVSIAVAGLQKIDSSALDALISKIQGRLNSVTSSQEASPAATAQQAAVSEATSKAPEPQQQQAQQQQTDPQPEEEEPPAKPKGPSRAALEVEVPAEFKKFDIIINRLLTDAPVRVVARLSARGLGNGTSIKEFTQKKLYAQFVSDFRNSLDPLVLWLSEEYYADDSRETYFKLVSRVVDEIIPKLEISDSRIFVRLLSELPELNREIIFKIKSSCLDPERSVVGARALKFLIMFKPPCREDCLDLVAELVKDGVQSVRGILERYRPDKQ